MDDIEVTDLEITRKIDLDLNGKVITGNLNYNVTNVFGMITLGNGTLEGNLTVNTPDASFSNNATIAGKTTITDVATATFTNNGNLHDVVLNDGNGTRFVNSANGKVVALSISGAGEGEIKLEGNFTRVEVNRSSIISLTNGNIENLSLANGANVTLNGDGLVSSIEGVGTVSGEIALNKAIAMVDGLFEDNTKLTLCYP